MTLSSRDQGLLVGLATVALGAAGWFLWLSPVAAGIHSADSQLATLDQQKSTLTSRVAFVDATARTLADNPDAAKLLNLAAPETSGMENLLASFDAMATASGVNLASIQPQAANDQPTQLTITMSVTGSFTALQSFVSALEHNVRPLAIQTLSFSGATSSTGDNVITASLSITTPVSAASSTKTAGTQ